MEFFLIDGFNESCNNIAASYLKVGDYSMSEISFQTAAKGNLPHLSYILRNMDPLGKEFKTVTCSVTGYLMFIEVHRGKEWVKHIKYQQELGVTTACTKRMTEATKRIGQKYRKGVTKDYFIFDSWFSSKKQSKYAMKFHADLVVMVYKNTKVLCKDAI